MYSFDNNKNKINIQKHGVPLTFGIQVLNDPNLIITVDRSVDYNEQRMRAFGTAGGTVYTVVFAEYEDITRLISVRRADKRETNTYFCQQQA